MRLSDKIQDTKVSIKQNSVNAFKIEKLLEQYQQVDLSPLNRTVEKANKNMLKKGEVISLIELMEKIALQNKILPHIQIEGGNDLSTLSNELVYNIRFQTREANLHKYLIALENIPYVSQIIQFQSNFTFNNNDIMWLTENDEIQAKINAKKESSDQAYAIRFNIFLE